LFLKNLKKQNDTVLIVAKKKQHYCKKNCENENEKTEIKNRDILGGRGH
jgi:hypothetical protein